MKGRTDRTMHEVLRQLSYGLYVIGVRGQNEEMNAFVASWVTQCSFNPPLLAVAIRKDSTSYQLLKKGRVFSLNLIDRKNSRLMRQLVKPADRVGDKVGKVGHIEEDTGAPILRKAFAYLECKVRDIHEPGDHALVIGEVVHAGVHERGESLTCADLGWHYAG